MSQADLFNSSELTKQHQYTLQDVDLKDIELILHEDLIDQKVADQLLLRLINELDWQQPEIFIAGRDIPIPRKQVWFGDEAYQYTYSGKKFTATTWHPDILDIKTKVESLSGHQFNSALCNLYRNGRDSVAWHADDEPELGPAPVIASYSLGETRSFHLRQKDDHGNKFKLDLRHNSLLVMGAGLQRDWEHQIPKSQRELRPRINLTFRRIV